MNIEQESSFKTKKKKENKFFLLLLLFAALYLVLSGFNCDPGEKPLDVKPRRQYC